MRYIFHTAAVFVVTAAMAAIVIAEQHESAAARQDILILKNGQTIKAHVTRADGVYICDFGDGQMRLKPTEVEMVCASLEEGYHRKRAAIQPGNVNHHLQLAQWCIRQELYAQAAAELADAKAVNPRHAMINVLTHRIEIALEPPVAAEKQAKQPAPGPTNNDLDQMVRSLPHGTVETFTQSVQPLLINRCASGNCHGAQSKSDLKLLRVTTGKSASRRITQRNLYSLLNYVDRENPAESRLLTAIAEPHGCDRGAIFDKGEAAQYVRLVNWIGQLAQCDRPASPDAPSHPEAGEPEMLSDAVQKAQPLQKPDAKQSAAKETTSAAVNASFEQSGDPFDPKVFNRRHASAPRPAEETHAQGGSDSSAIEVP